MPRSGSCQISINIRNPSYPDPYGGRAPEAFASTAPPNVNITDDDLSNARAKSLTVGVSQELRSGLALHLDGVFTNIDQMQQTANINTPDPVTGLRPRPHWGRIVAFRAGGRHEYRALYARVEKRFAGGHQYLVSYTLSQQTNDGGSGLVTDFYNPAADWGAGTADRRHMVAASGSVQLPLGVSVGAVWTIRSTMPFSARAGLDLNADGANTDFVPGTTRSMGNVGRNDELIALVNAWRAQNGRGPISADQIDTNTFRRFDVRAIKPIRLGGTRRLELMAQVFNLFGSDNNGGIGQTWVENALSDSFGRLLGVLPRQQAELGLRFLW